MVIDDSPQRRFDPISLTTSYICLKSKNNRNIRTLWHFIFTLVSPIYIKREVLDDSMDDFTTAEALDIFSDKLERALRRQKQKLSTN